MKLSKTEVMISDWNESSDGTYPESIIKTNHDVELITIRNNKYSTNVSNLV